MICSILGYHYCTGCSHFIFCQAVALPAPQPPAMTGKTDLLSLVQVVVHVPLLLNLSHAI